MKTLDKLKKKIRTFFFYMKRKKIIVLCEAYFGEEWMELSLKSVEPYVDKILVVISDSTYDNSGIEKENVYEVYEKLSKNSNKYFLLTGKWNSEKDQQNAALDHAMLYHKDCTHLFKVDTDEIYEPKDLIQIRRHIKSIKTFNKVLRVKMYTYIKSVYYRVSPVEPYAPVAIVPIRDYVRFIGARHTDGANIEIINCMMHHYSLVRRDNQSIKRKFLTRGDVALNQIVDNWYELYFENFSPQIKNFHTYKGHETQWKEIEIVAPENLPKGVEEVFKKWN